MLLVSTRVPIGPSRYACQYFTTPCFVKPAGSPCRPRCPVSSTTWDHLPPWICEPPARRPKRIKCPGGWTSIAVSLFEEQGPNLEYYCKAGAEAPVDSDGCMQCSASIRPSGVCSPCPGTYQTA